MFTNCHTHHSSNEKFEILQTALFSNPSSFHSIGIHPWEADNFDAPTVSDLLKSNLNQNTLAIGECGLDWLKGPDLKVQTSIFEQQILFSESNEFPLIIHCVKAWNELLVIRKKYQPKQVWVFHGFAKYGILEQVIKSGMMVSLGAGIIHHPKREEIVKIIPDNQLLLETDDLPFEIQQIYDCVAELKKISLQELNEVITHNFKNTFTRWQIG